MKDQLNKLRDRKGKELMMMDDARSQDNFGWFMFHKHGKVIGVNLDG